MRGFMKNGNFVVSTPKKTRQGNSQYTKRSATSRNSAKKKYRGVAKIGFNTVENETIR